MAAIIAQMTRANRERKKNKRFEIVIGKCMYEIGPFPEKYEPEVIVRPLIIFFYIITYFYKLKQHRKIMS